MPPGRPFVSLQRMTRLIGGFAKLERVSDVVGELASALQFTEPDGTGSEGEASLHRISKPGARRAPSSREETAMKNERETRKLDVEELEKRMAPLVIVDAPDEAPAPTTTGGGGTTPVVEAPEAPGNSGPHRSKPWQKAE